MRRPSKNRVLSLLLALTMIFTALPIGGVGANATAITPINILYNGQKVDELVLMEDEKITLTTSATGSDSLAYNWQICVDEESDKWVNIKGYTKDFCIVSYALIGSVLNTNGSAYLRCKVSDGAVEYLSDTVTVTVSYNISTVYEKAEEITKTSASPMAYYGLRKANKSIISLAATDEELKSCTIVINYIYEDASPAFEPFVATIEYGGDFNYTAVSPTVVGYAPYILKDDTYVDAKNVILNYENLTEDKVINVIYRPVLVDYTVRHYVQNVLDDNYEFLTETNGQQITGSQVENCEIVIDGFSPLYYEHLTAAADGSTVVEIYYDRNYYLVNFELDGGYGVEPMYSRYGVTVGTNEPNRAGYVFVGWELVGVDGVEPTEEQKTQYDINDGKQIAIPPATLTYRALWTTKETTYTVVYWRENADPNADGTYGYSYWGSKKVTGIHSGSFVDGSDDIPNTVTTTTINGETVDEKQYFTYNDSRTDKNILVEGDGSTVVNVYYTRNTYTIQFTGYGKCCLEAHTHGNNCERELICNLYEHTHNSSCGSILECGKAQHTAHTTDCLICGLDEHTAHTNDCMTCVKTEHTAHTAACYGDGVGGFADPFTQIFIGGLRIEGYVCQGITYTYIYIGGYWYYYSGATSAGSIAPTICDGIHTHNNDCYKDIVHKHTDDCYIDSLHTHTNSCYIYTCGSTEHKHYDNCYSACTIVEHTHTNRCNSNNTGNIIYVITAKYEQTIGDIWPTYDKLKAGNFAYKDSDGNVVNSNNQQFRGWSIDDVSSESVSKRITMTADLCDTSDGLKNATAQYGASYKYHLYYMFESFDQTSDENGNDRKLYDGIYYDSSSLFYQELMYSSDTTFRQKQITGMNPVAREYIKTESGDSQIIYNFLYYTRNHSTLSFHNVNDIVKEVDNILYEYPVKDVRDSDGDLVSSFVPDYPPTLEPNAYYFVGWFTTPECFVGTEYNFETATMPNSDLALYAKWAPVQHEVKVYLDATLSKQIGSPQLVDHNDLAVAPDEAVENGNYTFSGWFYVDNNGNEKAFVFNGIPITQDMNIYAKWSSKVAVKYEVYYKLKGTNTQIADPTIGSTLAGMNKTFIAKGGNELYPDYQDGYFPETNSHTVTMSIDDDNIFTFWYEAKASVPYTVKYIDEKTGEELLDAKYVKDNKKAVVTEVFETIEGYMPDAYQKRLVLSANSADENVITFYYTEDEKHAYYRIVHYVQNLAGSGYTEYRSIEAVGDIASEYSADALTISGFEFNGSKSKVNNTVTPVTGTKVSGTLTSEGLLIELFYDRINVNYTVKYLESGTNKVLEDEKTGNGVYGKQVSETYINIVGYELIGESTKTLTLAASSERNVITFYYQEKNITIHYVPVGGGEVSIGSENVLVKSGSVNGSVPTPKDGYKFVGWYLNAACTTPVNSSWIDGDTGKISPQKNTGGLYEEASYYAKFEANNTDLTIKKEYPKDADYSVDVNQTFIFDIKGVAGTATKDINLTVTVHGDGAITVTDLPIGTYTITEQDDWSWRYEPTVGKSEQTITLSPTEENIVTFENERVKDQWLDGDSYDVNIFNGKVN